MTNVNKWKEGLLSDSELIAVLEMAHIRGAINDNSFIGYDYKNQTWIEAHK